MEEKKTCLYDSHVALGALMSPFGGFIMPIQYSDITTEHVAVRTKVGIFDVSHMGEVLVEGPEAEKFVNHIFTNDVTLMNEGQILYGMMLYPYGGTVDDLLVYKYNKEKYLLVINAANIDKDFAWICSNKGYDATATNLSEEFGQIAIQGPEAEKVCLDVLGLDLKDLTFYTFKEVDGVIASRTGYTGEDGFEIYQSPEKTVEFWNKLVAAGVQPCGLGCRDTLRFEAGLPLYGHELSAEISPVMAGLSMFCKLDKAEFVGKDAIAQQKAEGVSRKLVGLEIHDKAIARGGYAVLDAEGNAIGEITTGYNSISLGKSIAFAFVDSRFAALGTELQVQIRKKVFPCTVVKKRFYQTNYKK